MTANNKPPKIFISHSSKDVEYAKAITELLEDIGLGEKDIICSSVPGYGIPLGEDVYMWLGQAFQTSNLHMIFALSGNYYDSPACLNEMGAAWVLKQKYDSVLLPGFEFKEIRGAVNPNQIGLKLDGDTNELKHRLGELKDNLIAEFSLPAMSATKWERHRDAFIKKTGEISSNTPKKDTQENKKTASISNDAAVLLVYAATGQGQILVLQTFGGKSICAGKYDFVGEGNRAREVARWESAIAELEKYSLAVATSYKRQIFEITHSGYMVADQAKEELRIDTDKNPEEYLLIQRKSKGGLS